MKNALLIASLTFLVAACGSDDSNYDPAWGEDQSLPAGKGDFLDLAEALEFDDAKEGSVTSSQMDVYKISLTRGDKIRLTKNVLSGDLRPDVSLFTSSGRSISSLDFSVSDDKLVKDYQVESTSDYLVAIRAYRNQGDGKYRVQAECTGGPCAGELNDPADFFDRWTILECIQETQACAFNELPRFNGAVGEARATNIWNDCAASTATEDGESCATACDADEDGQELCQFIVDQLPWYADQNDSCISTWDSCMDECVSIGDSWSSDIWDQEYAVCWNSGLNGDCNTFVRQLPECGGDITNEAAYCTLECHSIYGAFTDDTQDLCDHCDSCGVECQQQLWDEDFGWYNGIIGDVEETYIGEVDPFVIGDVCIVWVQTFEGIGEMEPGVYGLVEDGTCEADDLSSGTAVNVPESELVEVTNADELEELNGLRESVKYFRTSQIEEI